MNFKQLHISKELLLSLSKLGYKEPLEVQAKVIPSLLNKENMIVKARTGSGKTAAFGIPLCEMVDWDKKEPQALVLVPTRELALQVCEEIKAIGTYKKIKCVPLYGKTPYDKQSAELKQKCHIVVGTPGRVNDHIEKGNLDISKIEWLVLDEADEMLDLGFIEQIEGIMKQAKAQTLLFSATMPERIRAVAEEYIKNPLEIEIEDEEEKNRNIRHVVYNVHGIKQDKKLEYLYKVLLENKVESTIIFAKTQECVNTVTDYLHELYVNVDEIHGGMDQKDRISVMNDFKKGKVRVLVATDVAARGIDIDNVSHVINFEMPFNAETYIHRIGRSGRLDNEGVAISFASNLEMGILADVEDALDVEVKELSLKDLDGIDVSHHPFKDELYEDVYKKEDKISMINKDIMKIFIGGGKKQKVRAGDIVGSICDIEGLSGDDVGVITILDNASYVEILNNKGSIVLKKLKSIKGKKYRVEKSK